MSMVEIALNGHFPIAWGFGAGEQATGIRTSRCAFRGVMDLVDIFRSYLPM